MTSQLQRPQAIGVFPPPVAFLVLPAASDAQAPLANLLKGDLNQPLPAEWEFFRAAALGDTERAKTLLAGVSSPVAQYNLFVLSDGDLASYSELRKHLTGELAVMLQLVAFQLGVIDEWPDPAEATGELKAALLLARASAYLNQQDTAAAMTALEEAVECARGVSPVFAAQMLGQLAALRANTAGHDSVRVLENYQDAIALAADTPLDDLRAELWLNLGAVCQEHSDNRREWLTRAIRAYQQAIQCGLSETHYPEMYALAQNNLGLAYLTMPMVEASDSLRKAVAVQSFREALKVYQAHTHRLEWVSAKLNLANALQHLPSSHPEENLLQSVEIYEELLQTRTRAEDPVGYARLLANQANALAHLGLFSQSLEKANEAYKLFHWHNEADAANSVLELVATVHENLGNKQVTA